MPPRCRELWTILLASAAITYAQQHKPQLVLQTGPIEPAATLAFSPDGSTLAALSQPGSRVRIYSVASGSELAVLDTGAQNEPIAMARRGALRFSRDGQILWSLVGGSFRQFDARTGAIQQSKVYLANGPRVTDWEISEDGHFAAGQSSDHSTIVPLLNLRGGFERNFGHSVLAISGDGRFALTSGMEALGQQREAPFLWTIRDISTGQVTGGIKPLPNVRTLRGARQFGNQMRDIMQSAGTVGFFRFNTDASRLVHVGQNMQDAGIVHFTVYELPSGRERTTLSVTSRAGALHATRPVAALSPDLKLAAVLGERVSIVDLEAGNLVTTFDPGTTELAALALSADKRFLATAAVDKTITIWDLAQAAAGTVSRLRSLGETALPVHAVTFTPDSRGLIVGTSQSVHSWEFGTGTGTRSLRVPFTAPRTSRGAMGFQSQTVLSGTGDLVALQNMTQVTIWDRRTGRELARHAPQTPQALMSGAFLSSNGEVVGISEMLDQPYAGLNEEALDKMEQERAVAMRTHRDRYQKHIIALTTALSRNDRKKADEAEQRARQELPPVLADDISRIRKSMEMSVQARQQAQSTPGLPQFKIQTRLLRTTTGEQLWAGPGYLLGLSDDARWVARSESFGSCRMSILDRVNAQQSETTLDGCLTVARVIFSPKGLWVAATYVRGTNGRPTDMRFDSGLKVWELSPQGLGREVLTRTFDSFASTPLFSPDDALLAITGSGPPVELIDLGTGQTRTTLRTRNQGHTTLAFSPDGALLAVGSPGGETELWHTASGVHLASLVSLNGGADWLVVTPDGLFDGTPASWKQILWRFSEDVRDVAPVESYFTEYFYPGLLSELMRGNRPKARAALEQKDRRQPTVTLAAEGTGRMMTVKVSVAEPESGVGARDIRLFRNGTLVKVWRGDVLPAGQKEVTLQTPVPVVAGENHFTAYAFNRDNIKSLDADLLVQAPASLARKGVAHILAVGVNQYANPQYNLKYAVADAEALAAEIRVQQIKLNTYERVEITKLADTEATKGRILAALRSLAAQAQPEDFVVFFLAGHGFARGARYYQIPHDLGYTGPRDQLDENGLSTIAEHSISDLDLESAVESLDSGQFILIIDACNSGQALEAEEKRRGPMNSKGLAQLAYEKGMYILTAAQSYQAALEAAQLGHGFLTYSLVEEGLKKGAADYDARDGQILAREWFNFAAERVPQMQEQLMQTRDIAIVQQDQQQQPARRSTQKPRVFFRREGEGAPLIIAKP